MKRIPKWRTAIFCCALCLVFSMQGAVYAQSNDETLQQNQGFSVSDQEGVSVAVGNSANAENVSSSTQSGSENDLPTAEGELTDTGASGENGSETGDAGENGSNTGESGENGSETGDAGENDSDTGESSENGSETGDAGENDSDTGESSENGSDTGDTGENDSDTGESGEDGSDADVSDDVESDAPDFVTDDANSNVSEEESANDFKENQASAELDSVDTPKNETVKDEVPKAEALTVEPKIANGWYTAPDGKRYYYENGAPKKGWLVTGGERYWLDSKTGELFTNGLFYAGTVAGYAKPNGVVVRGFYTDANGSTYYANNDGVLSSGWYVGMYGNQLQRFYFDTTTYAAKKGLFKVGTSTYYGASQGYVLRGFSTADGNTYLANNDGILSNGWYVGMYGNQLQRFYFDTTTYAAKKGLFKVGTNSYYGGPQGYVLRGFSTADGNTYLANNDGILSNGWYVGMYGNQLQRFYFDPTNYAAKKGLFKVGTNSYYGGPQGYVLRGFSTADNNTYLANNDGVLSSGWYVGMYGNQLQRFYFDPTNYAAKKGLFKVGTSAYYGTSKGYVLRGFSTADNNTYLANNDGVLSSGWYVGMYGNQLQRFYFDPTNYAAKKGLFKIGTSTYYGAPQGYVLRGLSTADGNTYVANNDGVLSNGWYVGMYKNQLQRFYFDPTSYAAKKGLFKIGDSAYYGIDQGYVLRGLTTYNGNTYYANNDGVLYQGFWVTNQVAGGQLERYYFSPSDYTMMKGEWFKVAGSDYYAQASGACARGWVTIGGIKYQFNNDGVYLGNVKNPQGVLGIDVSKHQGPIDWAKVRASGIQFAIIRALGWSTASNYYEVDPYFHTNMQGAINAGIPVGAYLYSYAFNEAEMLEEINFILPALNQWKSSFTYPVYIDYEDPLIWEKTQSNDQRTNILRTGMNALAQNGFLPGFYTYYNAATTYINTQQLIDEGYDFWVAHFSASSNPWSGAGMWQYSNSGSVSGISGNVDLNYAYNDYVSLSKTVTVYDVNTGKNVQGKIKDLVPQMVQNEVGGGLGLTGTDKASLFKAQTLAARSYLQFHTSKGLIPTVGLTAPSAEVASSSNQVMRLGIYYNDSVINAAYGSCAGAYTNSAQNMGWGNYPYLTSVESPYDKELAPGFYPKTVTIQTSTMQSNIIKMVGQAQFNLYANDMSKWITAVNVDSHGNITGAVVCGVSISGAKFYENCWGLYGANLNSWKYNGNGTWTFSSNGNGHCVGLSQYGAAAYIAKGQSWRWVLNHYYPGTTIA